MHSILAEDKQKHNPMYQISNVTEIKLNKDTLLPYY